MEIQNNELLLGLRRSEAIHAKVAELSERAFGKADLVDKAAYMKELEFVLRGIQGTDTQLAIFNHETYVTELEVGHLDFWGQLPGGSAQERMVSTLGLLHTAYGQFPYESVQWFTGMLDRIPFDERVNMKIHHCGMRFTRTDAKPIRIFSQGMPIQVDEERNFKYTLNYVQNIHHLIKKDFPCYWIRFAYGQEGQFVRTYHSSDKHSSAHDLLSPREKEVLKMIAADMDTKEISVRLFISTATVGNHRSRMIEKLGARDTTALVQLAKMAGMI